MNEGAARVPPGPRRHPAGGRGDHGRARPAPARAHRRPAALRPRLDRRRAIAAIRAAKARGLRGHLRHGPALSRAQRARGRGLPHLRQGLAAAARRGRPARGGRRRCADGTIDVIASDHCPQDQDSKRLPFAQAACGVIGVADHAAGAPAAGARGRARPARRCCARMTEAPARHPGPRRRAAAPRARPADLVLFDPDAPWKITEASLQEPVQEHRLRGPAGRGPGAAHAGRRPHHLPAGDAEPLRGRGAGRASLRPGRRGGGSA